MPRRLRVEKERFYHIINRGVARDNIFLEDEDYEKFLEIMGIAKAIDAGYKQSDKFYKITRPYTTLKFLKNRKTVSHWAKVYRGIVLRNVSKHNIKEFLAL